MKETSTEEEYTSEMYVCGLNSLGQLGIKLDSKENYLKIPTLISLKMQIRMIACGEEHSAFISMNGGVYTMGSNIEGKLGVGDNNLKFSSKPLLVLGLKDTKSVFISCGWGHTGVITDNGELFTWGIGKYGVLGLQSIESKNIPTKVTFADKYKVNVSYISCGTRHTAIVDKRGRMFTCGSGDAGQLGTGLTQKELVPFMISSINEKIIQVECGIFHTLILTDQGRVFASGGNNYGQLGIGNRRSSTVPIRVSFFDNNSLKIRKIKASQYSIALSEQGGLYLWGTGIFGELLSPSQISQIAEPIQDISAGGNFGIALTNSGNCYSWGLNINGALGVGDLESRAIPIKILLNKPISSIACGGSHCILLAKSSFEKENLIKKNRLIVNEKELSPFTGMTNNLNIETSIKNDIKNDKNKVEMHSGSQIEKRKSNKNSIMTYSNSINKDPTNENKINLIKEFDSKKLNLDHLNYLKFNCSKNYSKENSNHVILDQEQSTLKSNKKLINESNNQLIKRGKLRSNFSKDDVDTITITSQEKSEEMHKEISPNSIDNSNLKDVKKNNILKNSKGISCFPRGRVISNKRDIVDNSLSDLKNSENKELTQSKENVKNGNSPSYSSSSVSNLLFFKNNDIKDENLNLFEKINFKQFNKFSPFSNKSLKENDNVYKDLVLKSIDCLNIINLDSAGKIIKKTNTNSIDNNIILTSEIQRLKKKLNDITKKFELYNYQELTPQRNDTHNLPFKNQKNTISTQLKNNDLNNKKAYNKCIKNDKEGRKESEEMQKTIQEKICSNERKLIKEIENKENLLKEQIYENKSLKEKITILESKILLIEKDVISIEGNYKDKISFCEKELIKSKELLDKTTLNTKNLESQIILSSSENNKLNKELENSNKIINSLQSEKEKMIEKLKLETELREKLEYELNEEKRKNKEINNILNQYKTILTMKSYESKDPRLKNNDGNNEKKSNYYSSIIQKQINNNNQNDQKIIQLTSAMKNQSKNRLDIANEGEQSKKYEDKNNFQENYNEKAIQNKDKIHVNYIIWKNLKRENTNNFNLISENVGEINLKNNEIYLKEEKLSEENKKLTPEFTKDFDSSNEEVQFQRLSINVQSTNEIYKDFELSKYNNFLNYNQYNFDYPNFMFKNNKIQKLYKNKSMPHIKYIQIKDELHSNGKNEDDFIFKNDNRRNRSKTCYSYPENPIDELIINLSRKFSEINQIPECEQNLNSGIIEDIININDMNEAENTFSIKQKTPEAKNQSKNLLSSGLEKFIQTNSNHKNIINTNNQIYDEINKIAKDLTYLENVSKDLNSNMK